MTAGYHTNSSTISPVIYSMRQSDWHFLADKAVGIQLDTLMVKGRR